MQCLSCNAVVGATAKFCEQCGRSLAVACPRCGHVCAAQAKFCGECGTAVGRPQVVGEVSAKTRSTLQSTVPSTSVGERRQLSIVFCDIVGSSALSTRLDPEVQSDVIAAFHACCSDVIKRLGGMVAQYLGDGVLAYFGYPIAHEDDAERAVRSGIALVEAISQLRPGPGVALQSRVGIATGLVVVGDLVREGVTQQNAAIGATTNLAARLQTLAKPDTVVISCETHRLVGSMFQYADLGTHSLKGFSEPVQALQVLSTSAIENRFEALRDGRAGAILGREEELELLKRRWDFAKQGQGRVVLLTGEPGIGKSRLTAAVRDLLKSEAHTQLSYNCSPFHTDSALYPIINQLLRSAAIERQDDDRTRLDKIEALLARSNGSNVDTVPLIASLLSIQVGDRYSVSALSPQQTRERILAFLVARLKHLAGEQPVLVLFEDLHWIDPTSLELLSRIVALAADIPVLVLGTARPEFQAPWSNQSHISTIPLNRLDRLSVSALIAEVTLGRELPAEVMAQIIARTDGVPLFIEEVTKDVLESGLLQEAEGELKLEGPLPPLAIPATIQASLLARIDRLSSVKNVAQIGAVIGREFSHALLSCIAPESDAELRAAIAQLIGAGLVFQHGLSPNLHYTFKHALVQDAVYSSLVRSRRQQIHGEIARAIEAHFPDIAAGEPELLAHHFAAAGQPAEAIEYWVRAGEHAQQRSAYAETVTRFAHAIDLVKSLRHSQEALRRELGIRLKMGPALIVARRPQSAEVEAFYNQSRELVEQLGDNSHLFPVLWGQWFVSFSRNQNTAALSAGEHLLKVAQEADDQALLLEAHHALWATLSQMGRADEAMIHLERGLALYDPQLHSNHAALYGGHDPGTCCRYHLAANLWIQGFPDRAVSVIEDAQTLSCQLNHPMSTAITSWFSAWLHYHRGNREGAGSAARQVLELTKDHGVRGWDNIEIVLLWATTKKPLTLQLLSEMQNRMLASGAAQNWRNAFCLSVLARLYSETGHPETGIGVLDAIPVSARSGIYAAELRRLEVELRLKASPASIGASERDFLDAIAQAQAGHEKSLELRAATSLAALWKNGGRKDDARVLLEPIYGWFSEGHTTNDLQAAKSLLQELG